MTQILVQIQRAGIWKPVAITEQRQPTVAVSAHGEITINMDVGYLHPPWRVAVDGHVVFERSR